MPLPLNGMDWEWKKRGHFCYHKASPQRYLKTERKQICRYFQTMKYSLMSNGVPESHKHMNVLMVRMTTFIAIFYRQITLHTKNTSWCHKMMKHYTYTCVTHTTHLHYISENHSQTQHISWDFLRLLTEMRQHIPRPFSTRRKFCFASHLKIK